MNKLVSTWPSRLGRKAAIAQKKLSLFQSRYGAAHLALLYQAAFPVALTPDLLYRLWANFQRDIKGNFLSIPWIAVSDILLSELCQEVGEALYEIDEAVRDQLLLQLQSDQRFGQRRVQELSDFLLDYVRDQLQSNDLDVQDFARAQRWTALAHTQPGYAGRELALNFQSLMSGSTETVHQNKIELVRMAALVATLATPLSAAGLSPLVEYARGVSGWVRGDRTSNSTASSTSNLEERSQEASNVVQIAGIELPVPGRHTNQFEVNGDNRKTVQDFSHQTLRGRSFKGADLAGANFMGANIKSANFLGTNLAGASFQGAKLGLQRRWLIVLLTIAAMLSVLSGLAAAAASLVTAAGVIGLWASLAEGILSFGLIVPALSGLVVFLGLVFTVFKGTVSHTYVAFCLSLIGVLLLVGGTSAFVRMSVGVLWDISMLWEIAVSVVAVIAVSMTVKLTAERSAWKSVAFAGGFTAMTLMLLSTSDNRVVGLNSTLPVAVVYLSIAVALEATFLGRKLKRPLQLLLLLGMIAGFPICLFVLSLWTSGGVIFSTEGGLVNLYLLLFGILMSFFSAIPLVLSGRKSFSGIRLGTLLIFVYFGAYFRLFPPILPFGYLYNSAANTMTIALLTGLIAWAAIITLAVAMNVAWAESNSRAIATIWILSVALVPLAVSVSLGWRSRRWVISMGLNPTHFSTAFAIALLLASAIVVMGMYVGWCAMSGIKRFATIKELAVSFASVFGTSFYGANLTEANFTDAVLKNADFRTDRKSVV